MEHTQKVKLWFDAEGDYLEVQFSDGPGFMRTTAHDAVMERVDEQGHVLGSVFSALAVSKRVVPWKPSSWQGINTLV
jgi:hypothetical protein